jgi:hypothetical protein
MGAALLLLPYSGVPVSFDQIEERSHRDSGSSADDVVKSRVFRDTSGRLRIEESAHAVLVDGVAGSRVVLLSRELVAYRTPWPRSSEGRLAFLGIVDGGASSRELTATTEFIGRRTIEDLEFDGTRIIHAAEGEPQPTRTVEQWYSDELKLIGFVVASGPHETYTARIENLRREEPNTGLFAIPADYKIVDLELSLPDQQ